jgi:hypothetical protein
MSRRLLIALVPVLVLLVAPPAEAKKKRKKKVDLKVQRVANVDYIVTPDRLDVEFKVKNVGDKRVNRADAEIRITELTGDLPALAPAFVESVRIDDLAPGDATVRRGTFEVPLGRYRVEVCVKFKKDKRKGNNCDDGTDLSVIPQSWQGTAAATGPLGPGVTRSHKAEPGMGFFFKRRTADGFEYEGSGRVRNSVSGTANGCRWSGQKTVGIRSSETLTLNEDLLGYRFKPFPGGESYPVKVDCPSPRPDTTFTMRTEIWLIPLPQSRDRSSSPTLAPGAGFASLGPVVFTWHLRAE